MMIAFICTAAALSAVLLYLFLIFPSPKRHLPNEMLKKPIAHRGIHVDGIPENSISAFGEALRRQLPIELDVRLTSDGIPVVFHDRDLKRMCGKDILLSSVAFDDLHSYFLEGSSEEIPSLAQVLDFIDGRIPVLIELKGEDRSPVAIRTAEVLREYSGDFAVESFNPYHLMRFRRCLPHIPLGLLSGRRLGKTAFTAFFGAVSMHMLLNFLFRPCFIAFRYTDRLPFGVKLSRKLGAALIGWTFYGEGACSEYSRGFDGVICDYTD